jgi:hypothetical protein
MSDREFPFEPDSYCDSCGAKGAWDIYGDLLCEKCLEPAETEEKD